MNLAHLFAIADAALIEKRLELCNSCDKIKSSINMCVECGCIVNLKVKLNIAKCPLDKW